MDSDKFNYLISSLLIFTFGVCSLIFTGCGPGRDISLQTCPAAKSVFDASANLNVSRENLVSLKARGKCHLEYHEDKKLKTEDFRVKVWLNPPDEIYLQGDIAFDGRGIILGSNQKEFWLAIRPEISSYYWGKWEDVQDSARLIINPRVLLEGLGVLEVDESWLLAGEGNFDVLVKKRADGLTGRKIYIDRCSGYVSKVKYFDNNGRETIVTELDRYKKVAENLFMPFSIQITTYYSSEESKLARISLDSIKPVQFTDKLKQRLFNLPNTKGYKHIYKVNSDFELIEQIR